MEAYGWGPCTAFEGLLAFIPLSHYGITQGYALKEIMMRYSVEYSERLTRFMVSRLVASGPDWIRWRFILIFGQKSWH